MNKIFRVSVMLGLLLSVHPVCSAQQKDVLGWQEARWGMVEKDILKAFGPKLKKLPKRLLFLERHVDYVIPEFEIEGNIYTVFFQMDDGNNKLSQVLIRLNEMKSQEPRNQLFESAASLLAREYGNSDKKTDESQLEPSAKVKVVDISHIWKFPTTTVELGYSWDDQIYASLLTIRYFPTK